MSLSDVGAIIRHIPGLFLTFLLERSLFLRVGWLQQATAHLLAGRRAEVGPVFDADFYLAQITHPLRNRRAARAPLLHYLLIGWREQRSPNAAFDPVYVRRALRTPFWRDAYADWRRAGPPSPPRSEYEEAHPEPVAHPAGQPIVLVFNHQRGGGSTRYLGMFEQAIMATGKWPVRLRRLTGRRYVIVGVGPDARPFIGRATEDGGLSVQIGGHTVDHILVNHVVDHPPALINWIEKLADDLAVPYDVILHDYFFLCPRINLIDDTNRFCGVAPVERCVSCVARSKSDAAGADVGTWRERHVRFLRSARRVVVPSEDARRRLLPWLGRPLDVLEPEQEVEPPSPPARERSRPLRVVSIGALSYVKGAAVLETLAEANQRPNAPLSLALIGQAVNGSRLRRAGVEVTGEYREEGLANLIQARKPDLFFFPAIWPETWSFTLSHALATGLPAVVFDIGAPADRLRRLDRDSWILPLDLADRPDEIIEALEAIARG